jgi:hypothetical protein
MVKQNEEAPEWTKPLREDNDTIKAALAELKNRRDILNIDRAVYGELESYLAVKKLLPEILAAEEKGTVRKAQTALYELQGKLDRVATIHLSTRKMLRALDRLEIMSKGALAEAGRITEKTSKPSADQMISLVLPELASYQSDWTYLGKMCQDVQDHLGNAQEVLKLQMKMDENLHWAQRSGA